MWITITTLISLYLLLKWLELLRPLRTPTKSWRQRLVINLVMTLVVFATAAITVKPTSQFLIQWTFNNHVGLLRWLALPFTLQFILGFLLMDVTFYYWHRANHVFPLLWRFHNVHHIDPDLDVTTAFRFHFIEIAYSAAFRVIQLTIIGINPIAFAFYEFLFQVNTLFQHSNIHLPIRVEAWLNKLIVTPRMHGIHHSQVMNETNANYSVIFSLWDRLHKTLHLNIPQQEINIGVPAYTQATDNNLPSLLTLPFTKQRRYWGKEYKGKITRGVVSGTKTTLAK